MELFAVLIAEWNKDVTDRAKLQHAYIFLIVSSIVIAGITALINPTLGYTIVSFAGFLFLALVANAVIWALLKTFIIDRYKQKRTK